MGCLYRLDFPNGKSYIGITAKTAEERFRNHVAAHRKAKNQPLYNAMKKHGAQSVKVTTLVLADDWQYLCELERRAIDAYGTRSPRGYNATDGGEGVQGHRHSEETRAKLREKRAQQPSSGMKGRHLSVEVRRALSKALTGRNLHTEESKRRISEASRGNRHAAGWRHTEEAKQSIAKASIGRKHPKRVMSEAERQQRSDALRLAYARGTKRPSLLGVPATEERKRRMSESMKAKMADPAQGIKRSAQAAFTWAMRQGRPMSVLGAEA